MFESLNVFGYGGQEDLILAGLITGDPVLLIGAPGVSKTRLIARLGYVVCGAWQKIMHGDRPMRASVINAKTSNPEDWVGFPFPNKETGQMTILFSPQSLINTLLLAVDEVNRQDDPSNQNRLYTLVNDRYVDGVELPIRFVFGMMNPFAEDSNDGVTALNPSLADRFAIFVKIPSIDLMENGQRSQVISASMTKALVFHPSQEKEPMPDDGVIEAFHQFWVEAVDCYQGLLKTHKKEMVAFLGQLEKTLRNNGILWQGRRLGMVGRAMLAVHAIRKSRGVDDLQSAVRDVLHSAFPNQTYDKAIEPTQIEAFFAACASKIPSGARESDNYQKILAEPDLARRVVLGFSEELNPRYLGNLVGAFLKSELSDTERALASFLIFNKGKAAGVLPVEEIEVLGKIIRDVLLAAKGAATAFYVQRKSQPDEVALAAMSINELNKTPIGKVVLMSVAYAYGKANPGEDTLDVTVFNQFMDEASSLLCGPLGELANKNDIIALMGESETENAL